MQVSGARSQVAGKDVDYVCTEGRCFHPAKDAAGMRTAFLELLEEARREPGRRRTERTAEHAANREEILASLDGVAEGDGRTLADGYYDWAGYVSWLATRLEGGLVSAAGMTENEAAGIEALRAAKAEFAREHPPCPHCGWPMEASYSMRCVECGKETHATGGKS